MKKLLLSALAGCLAVSQAFALTVTDGQGNEVELNAPAQRIISLVPSATEVLFEVGAGELIVGAVEWSNYPEAAKSIPRVGDSRALNVEAIIAMNPDLIVWGWRNDQVDQLEGMGIPTFFMKPESFVGIEQSLRNAGKLTGNETQAEERIQQFVREIVGLRNQYSQKAPVTALYQISADPIYTVNNTSFLAAIMEVCGVENIFADLETAYPVVSKEAVVAQAPQAIIMSARDDSFEAVWQGLDSIPAVAKQQFVTIAPDDISRPVPGLVKGAKQMCEQIDEFRQ